MAWPRQEVKGHSSLQRMGRQSIRPAMASQREGVVDLTTEVFVVLQVIGRNLDSFGVKRLVEPRECYCSARLPKGEW